MTGKRRVFISYSRDDRSFVEQLSADLRQCGVQTWVDVENIKPGARWDEALSSGLKSSSALIFVLSGNMVGSQWMLTELQNFASSQNKLVFPVIIDDVDPLQLPPAIRDIQWAEFRYSYKHGLESLLAAMGIDSKVPATPIPTQKQISKGYAFISYTQDDVEFVKSLRNFLEKKKYAFWDYDKGERDYGAPFLLELESRIKEASATLSIVTPSWKNSRWAIREFLFSEQVNTPVFLLKAKEVEPTLAIADMTPINFTQDVNIGFSKLENELEKRGL